MNLNVHCDVYSDCGLSRYARAVIRSLIGAGHNVAVTHRKYASDMIDTFPHADEILPLVGRELEDYWAIHVFNPENFVKDPLASVNIGIPFYEASKLPEHLAEKVKLMDGIISPSSGTAYLYSDVLGLHKVKSIDSYAYEGVANLDEAYLEKMQKHIDGRFTFLFVGAAQHRKGLDLLLAAYWHTFWGRDDVNLILKVYGDFSDNSRMAVLRDFNHWQQVCGVIAPAGDGNFYQNPGAPRILLELSKLSEAEMSSLYSLANVFVLPSRGEGFGLPYLEAAMHGVPVLGVRSPGAVNVLNRINSFTAFSRPEPCSHMSLNIGINGEPNFPVTNHWWTADSISLGRDMLKLMTDDDVRRCVTPNVVELSKFYNADVMGAQLTAALDNLGTMLVTS